MTKETAENTANYIIDHCHGEKVTLHWLGGEPLYNKQVISLITKRLQESGIEIKSTMISNGFLFDNDTVNEAKELWKLKRVQITLDGTEQTYNRCKAYIYNDVNPYRIVISNIHRLIDKGIHVAIRLNIDIHNADNLAKLIEELRHEFCDSKGMIVYLHQLFEESKGSMAMRITEKRHAIFQKMIELENRLTDYGLRKGSGLKHQIKVNRCMADNDHSIVVFPQGNIGKCQHYTENNFIGHICDEQMDKNMISKFKECREIDECNCCFRYPDCVWLQMCEDQSHCYPEEREYLHHATQRGMIEDYVRFKNKDCEIDSIEEYEFQD
jgi:sulfatase maturation enzyme AslB (radical SAM superfamily)